MLQLDVPLRLFQKDEDLKHSAALLTARFTKCRNDRDWIGTSDQSIEAKTTLSLLIPFRDLRSRSSTPRMLWAWMRSGHPIPSESPSCSLTPE